MHTHSRTHPHWKHDHSTSVHKYGLLNYTQERYQNKQAGILYTKENISCKRTILC